MQGTGASEMRQGMPFFAPKGRVCGAVGGVKTSGRLCHRPHESIMSARSLPRDGHGVHGISHR